VTEESWTWLVREVLGARSDLNRDRFLPLATTAILDGDIARLSESKQVKALWAFAVDAGSALRQSEVSTEEKCEFVIAIPRLLRSVQGPLLIDPVLYFWEQLLAPVPTLLGIDVVDAVRIALGEQLSSPQPVLRWSAARAVSLLPPNVAESLAKTQEDAFEDPVLRGLAFPKSGPRRRAKP
jgi:hypothetical protein